MEMLTGELKTQYKKPYLGLCGHAFIQFRSLISIFFSLKTAHF
jgi:hypothetical protein